MLRTTNCWSVGESSYSRNSFNSLVTRKSFDVPEDMMKVQSMGKQAWLGPDYVPNPIMARVVAGNLVATRPDVYRPCVQKSQLSPATVMRSSQAAPFVQVLSKGNRWPSQSQPQTPSQTSRPGSAAFGAVRSGSTGQLVING
eukprot:TRINITY_DN60577_c0_g1_i1.p1 TRINITY_DN60577_c0_g1~~TRINITY_DN60577_c0_g1_i1.p1  ORF type:complete len:167 (+),score=19.62 TRINITY_DN60577_c0_g1_i1:77-502(+)